MREICRDLVNQTQLYNTHEKLVNCSWMSLYIPKLDATCVLAAKSIRHEDVLHIKQAYCSMESCVAACFRLLPSSNRSDRAVDASSIAQLSQRPQPIESMDSNLMTRTLANLKHCTNKVF
ncbi:hypothetical protein T12_722 [Trichinella patagoniensis]|uniref:Uncharacterized protein n=1 Tax=Trichinella patagoniensis TaxID=990121 RepID=A0A0V0ZI12_9BILA|nr:hypothetical protein T12_722 [Trichinella patagoniensis]